MVTVNDLSTTRRRGFERRLYADPVLALEAITVVAIEQAVAAPLATRHLADLGARVIKVERVDGGDFARHFDHAVQGQAAHFVWLNRSKESMAVDLSSESGGRIIRRLIDSADVFLQNLGPGAAARLGLGSAELRASRPRLVTVDMSGYGPGGPYAQKKAYDMLVQSEAGLIAMTGTPEFPSKTGVAAADIAAGMYAFSGVLAALLRRTQTGSGGHVDVSMFDAVVEWMGYPLYTAMYTGGAPPRSGLGHAAIVPYDGYPTQEGGRLLIGVQNDRQWRSFVCEVLEKPELVDDPRYASNMARVAHRVEVDEIVATVTRTIPAAELARRLDAAGIPNAALNEVSDVVEHPQLAARDRWREVGTPNGPIRAVLPPITLDGEAPRMDPIPALGEHTDAILREFGYTAADIADLRASGVVGGG
jgi:crotonobetainyl-CoA:carnitine CoA-transferase CaiB-like acyl-CoA transferase